METEYQKQRRGEWFDATCEELSVFYVKVQRLLQEYNATDVSEQEKRRALLKEITGSVGKNVTITPPLYCDYGCHLFLEDDVYINTGSIFLDAGYVRIGAMAYLKQQYKVVALIFVALCLVFAFMSYVLHVQNPWVPFAFLTGGIFLMPSVRVLTEVCALPSGAVL